MKEEFLQYIWANSLFYTNEFVTYNGRKITVLDPGKYNRDAGPDFFNARIALEDIILAGNVEIHLRSSDWYRHGHHRDEAYNNVILSVVKEDDVRVYTQGGQEVECIVLEYADFLYDEYCFMRASRRQPGCFRHLELLEDSLFYLTLQALAIERLERKVDDLLKIYRHTGNDWGECFYRILCKYWSGNVNSDSFYQLALTLPFRILLRYADRLTSVEALLFGSAGLLETAPEDEYTVELKKEYTYLSRKHRIVSMKPAQWKFMRIRPEAFPTVRLALLAVFLTGFGKTGPRLLELTSLSEIRKLLEIEASSYWESHYSFDKTSPRQIKRMGENLQKIVLINAMVPFLFFYGKERGEEKYKERAIAWLEEIGPEKNYIVASWEGYGFCFDSALQTQALIQLRKEYCDTHRCLQCRIGREVLKSIGQ